MTGHGSEHAWADSVGIAIERVAGPVEAMHRTIADPWLRLGGPKAVEMHERVVGGIYKSVRAVVTTGAVTAGGVALRNRQPLRDSKFGLGMQAFTNSVWGDELERRSSPAHIELGLRDTNGTAIEPTSTGLAQSFPRATGRIVVLLHGLGQTESKWQTRTGKTGAQQGLADVLGQHGFTPLLVRYNSGRHVPDNGADLAKLLEAVVQAWPVDVREVALVGFSMGGLVARSAIRAGHEADHAWARQVSHLVTLATPHLGSPIEKGARAGAWALGIASKTKPLRDFVDTRSQGIRDLRHGTVARVDDETMADEPLPARIKQHFLAGVTTADPQSLFGRLVGDFVVRPASGTGRGTRRRLDPDDVRIIEGVRHTGLFHNPEVHRQVAEWLAEPPSANA